MAEQKLPKLTTRVRFPSPAPTLPTAGNTLPFAGNTLRARPFLSGNEA